MKRWMLALSCVLAAQLWLGSAAEAQLTERFLGRRVRATDDAPSTVVPKVSASRQQVKEPEMPLPGPVVTSSGPVAKTTRAQTTAPRTATEVASRVSAATTSASNTKRVRVAPLISVETKAPVQINVGKKATFTIRVENTGNIEAQEVLIQAALPRNATFVRSVPDVGLDDDILVFEVGDLAIRQSKNITVELIPTERGEIDLATKLSFAMYTESVVQVREPKLTVELQNDTQAIVGDKIKIVAVIKNEGDGVAESVQLRQIADIGVETATKIQGIPETIATLAPGASRTIQLTALADTPGLMKTAVKVQADGDLESTARSEIFVTQPILTVKLTGPSLRFTHRVGDYVVKIANPGDAAAENVAVRVNIPKGLQVTAIEKRARLDQNSGVLTWTMAKLAPGADDEMKFRVKAVGEGEQVQSVVVSADRDLQVNVKHMTRVMGYADILMTVTDTVSPIEVGGTVEFEIEFRNRGTKSADAVQLVAILPEGVKPLDGEGYRIQGNQLTFDTISSIKPADKMLLKFRAIGEEAGDHKVSITLNSDSLTSAVVAEETTTFYKADGSDF